MQNLRQRALLCGLRLTPIWVGLACGGQTTNVGGDGSPASPEGSATAPGTTGGLASGEDGSPPAQVTCDTAGERRDAAASEDAQYCVCEKDMAGAFSYLLWRCYGPSPTGPAPQASCAETFMNPGGQGSCTVDWNSCSDGHVYMVSCDNSICYCLVDGKVTVSLEALSSCPETKSQIDSLCGWKLQ